MKIAQQFCARSVHCSVQRGQPQAACKRNSTPTLISAGRCSWSRNGSPASNSNAISIAPSSIRLWRQSNFQIRRRWSALTPSYGRKAWIRWRFIGPRREQFATDLKSRTKREGYSQERRKQMRKMLILVAMSAAITTVGSGAKAQVDLSAYADAEG